MGAIMASTKQAWAWGGTIFAATMMLLIGVYQFFVGLAAIVQDDFFVVGENYTYEVDTTAWGWIHMAIGALAVVTGFFLFTGANWARWVGIGLASLSAIANFFFLPYYPLWSMLLIALDIFAIWAIATVRPVDEVTPTARAAGMGTGQPSMAQQQYATGQPGTAGAGYEAAQTGERWPAGNVPSGTGSGRHWAPEDARTPEDARMLAEQQAARERAEAAARGATGTGTYTAGPSGVTPPDEPPQSTQR
jgi:hypothetical protein